MKQTYRIFVVFALLCMVAISAHAAVVVARVGDQVITDEDVNNMYELMQGAGPMPGMNDMDSSQLSTMKLMGMTNPSPMSSMQPPANTMPPGALEALSKYGATDTITKKKVLEMLIENKLIYIEAKQKKFETDPVYQKALNDMKEQLMVTLYVDSIALNKNLSETEIKNAKEEYTKVFVPPKTDGYSVRVILVANQDEATDVRTKLSQGMSFETLAKEKSIHASASHGGDLGTITPTTALLPEAVRKIVFGLKSGQISPAIKTAEGYYVVKMIGKAGDEQMSDKNIEERAKSMAMMGKKKRTQQELVTALKKQIPITIYKSKLD